MNTTATQPIEIRDITLRVTTEQWEEIIDSCVSGNVDIIGFVIVSPQKLEPMTPGPDTITTTMTRKSYHELINVLNSFRSTIPAFNRTSDQQREIDRIDDAYYAISRNLTTP